MRVKKTTNNITKGIIAIFQRAGGSAWRINTQGQRDDKLGIWRKSGQKRGISDVIACYKGQMYGIEVKFDGDKQSEHQKEFQKDLEAAGGIYYLCEDWNEFLLWANKIFT